jgi:hypothetical protein
MSARFQAKARQHLTVVITYAPTDMGEDVAKDAFYLMMFACLKEAPISNKVVVRGDFNAELGSAWQKQGNVTSKFHLHRGVTKPSDNGARLLDLAATFHFRAANTFFKHRLGHLATWQHTTTHRWYVKDYILVFGSAMQGVNDCRVFSHMNHGPNNHLLVLLLQLHLRALKHDAPARQRLWDGALLWEPGCQATFRREVGNRFAILPFQAFDPEEERGRFVMAYL